MKVYNYQIVMQEFPDEIALALNISGCQNKCPGCHSKYLWDDVGEELNISYIDKLVEKNIGITCVGFMGGDQDISAIGQLALHIKNKYHLKTGWYSGKDEIIDNQINCFDYIKLGPYIAERGGLDKTTTNQVLLKISGNCVRTIENITYKIQR